MNEKEFCYWLQGFFEMTNPEELTPEQVKMIRQHLCLVFDNKSSEITFTPDNIFNNPSKLIC